jgi:hypothetical protein
MIEAWLILAVALTILYLTATLRDGRGSWKIQSVISALMPALLPLPLLLPSGIQWPSLFTRLFLLRLNKLPPHPKALIRTLLSGLPD